jgi:hypothetical protein
MTADAFQGLGSAPARPWKASAVIASSPLADTQVALASVGEDENFTNIKNNATIAYYTHTASEGGGSLPQLFCHCYCTFISSSPTDAKPWKASAVIASSPLADTQVALASVGEDEMNVQ